MRLQRRNEKKVKRCLMICFAMIAVLLMISGEYEVHAAKQGITKTSNYHRSNRKAYLYKVNGGYERVEWIAEKNYLLVEKYNTKFNYVSSKNIQASVIAPKACKPQNMIYGGVYEGKKYNFVITGQFNKKQSNSLATIRVTKFSKKWKLLGKADLNNKKNKKGIAGIEVYEPFDFASVDMEELGGNLWISTGRTGFGEIHHQGKLNIIIREKDMKYIGSASDFWHSFDQYLTVCKGKMYQLEQSEGSRGVFVSELDKNTYKGGWTNNAYAGAAVDVAAGRYKVDKIFSYYTEDGHGMWSYGLYGSIGGFAASESKGKLLSVGTSINQENVEVTYQGEEKIPSNNASSLNYNIWIRSTSLDMKNTTGHILTSYEDGGGKNAGIPYIAKVNNNKFLVIWEVENSWDYSNISNGRELNYLFVNAEGEAISRIYKMNGYLSSVEPINDKKGNIVWYVTKDNTLIFYIIKPAGSYLVYRR